MYQQLSVACKTSLAHRNSNRFDYTKLLNEFIEFKNDTNMEAIFKEKREGKEYPEFLAINIRKIHESKKICPPAAHVRINVSLRIITYKNKIRE